MQKISEKNLAFIMLGVLLVFLTVLSLLSDGVYGGADNYTHYRLAKYSFRHPEFFLDLWGKPVFTTGAALFAQYGFNGIKIFNILAGLLTALLTFRIAQKLNYRFPLLAIIMLCFMPMYFVMMMSSLTEIIFSFCLTWAVWLFFNKKYYGFAIVASLLPFARTEGFFLLPFLCLPLVYEKKFRAIPLLLTATVFYSVIGSFYYKDLFWVINEIPYISGKNIYGSGNLFRFVGMAKEITGLLTAFLLVAGIAAITFSTLRKKENSHIHTHEWMLLFIPFFVYLALHSVLWWQGLGSSAGLTRVIAAVLPPAALLALRGWNFIYDFLPRKKYVQYSLSVVLLFFILREPFVQNKIPVPLSGNDAVVYEAAQWLKQSEYYDRKIYYYDPTLCFFLDVNPFDESRIRERVHDTEQPHNGIGSGEIIVWDSHFGTGEGRLSLERLTGNSHFTLKKKFEPADGKDENNFGVYIFRRNDE